MELNGIALSKTLHYVVEQFISCTKSCFDPEVLESRRIFCEIIKRSGSLIQDIRSIALHSNSALERSGLCDAKVHLNDQIQELVHNLVQQDFVELLLNAHDDHFNITECELHNFLHSGAMMDITTLSPFAFSLGLPLNFDSTEDVQFQCENSLTFSLPSSQFINSCLQFEDEVNELRRIMKNGFSSSDLDMFNVASVLKYESVDVMKKEEFSSHLKPVTSESKTEINSSVPSISNIPLLDSAFDGDSDTFLCWESCLGNFLSEHEYISEAMPEMVLNNISKKESQAYYSLLNSSDAIPENVMVHDILDLLIGVASSTFYYDTSARKFKLKFGVHISNLSHDCTTQVLLNFMESGSIYYLLHKFSNQILHSSEGLIFKGFLFGIQQVLSVYKEYIAAIKMNFPTILSLRKDVAKNAEILQDFGVICGIDVKMMEFKEVPKGLGLLSYLHVIAQSHRQKESKILIAVLLKYTYTPYFGFLNKWLTEGICDDLYGEFQILEDFNYLLRRDAMYWKFAYTQIIDDPKRVVPQQISAYSQSILDCGKSINLLKICCPNLFSLKFLFHKPPPPLSMVFSLPSIISKLKESSEYTFLKEKAEEAYNLNYKKTSMDNFYLECQKYVSRRSMLEVVQRKWNILCASAHLNSNIYCSSQVNHYLKDKKSFSTTTQAKISNVSSGSLNSLIIDLSCQDFMFSGKLFGNIGLLFSSCGYHNQDLHSNLDDSIIDCTSTFHKQLELISYSENCVDLPISLAKYKGCFPLQEMDLLSECHAYDTSHATAVFVNDPLETSPDQAVSTTVDKSIDMTAGVFGGCYNKAKSFVEKLASLLISEYGDSIDDVYNCIYVTSLQRLMMQNFEAVLKMRTHLVERTVMKYIVKDLGLDALLCNLRNLYFLKEETFSQTFCEQLFPLVMKCRTPRAFGNWAVLNEILQLAISDCNRENDHFFSSLNINISCIPDHMPSERSEFLHLLRIEYEVEWPLNIIVHPTCIQQYFKIFSILIEIEFLCWLLSCIWRTLIVTSKELQLDNTPQFRKIMLNRFEMEQFIRIIRNSIHQHLQGPLWEFLQRSLSVEESSIDGLESVHMQYLEKALARCFLTDETHVLHELLTVMLCQIYKFSSTVYECRWTKNTKTGCYEVFEYSRLLSYFGTFKQYQKVFLKRIMKETLTKKFGRQWDKDYQDFLDTILETEKDIP